MDKERLTKLIASFSDDSEMLEIIYNCLISFEEYHKAVYELEVYKRVFNSDGRAERSILETAEAMDRTRTRCHDALIANVAILNRMAGGDPVYSGTVSKERPYRREVANAVFKYMETVINERS